MARFPSFFLLASIAVGGLALIAPAISRQSALSPDEKAISKEMGGLRGMTDSARAVATKGLALQIRKMSGGMRKVQFANGLANLSTEGDCGHDTLQEVTTTLAVALSEVPAKNDELDSAYDELAQLAKYEHMDVSPRSPKFVQAQTKLTATDNARAKVDFTLNDIHGKPWKLSSLHGKVVLVNFWATWCPPCRKEMPDLQTLSDQFKDQGFVILSISDEDASKVNPFIDQHKYAWPMLLDPGRKVNEMYQIQGIPKSFLYNRKGQMVAQTIDMRTKAQFLDLLSKVGLKARP